MSDFIFGVKIVQKGAGEIRAKYNFNHFSPILILFRWVKNSSNWITSQQPNEAYKTKKWGKKTARTPENIALVKDDVGRHRGRRAQVVSRKCQGLSFPFQFRFCQYVDWFMKYSYLNG